MNGTLVKIKTKTSIGSGISLEEGRLNRRKCICDQPPFPLFCSDCSIEENVLYDVHKAVVCRHDGCEKMFHFGCLSTDVSTDATLADLDERYICMECKCREESSAHGESISPYTLVHMRNILTTLSLLDVQVLNNTAIRRLNIGTRHCR